MAQSTAKNAAQTTSILNSVTKMINSPTKKLAFGATVAIIVIAIKGAQAKQPEGSRDKKGSSKKGRGNVDAEFWKRIKKLIGYVIPNGTCREARYMYLLSVLLVIRTLMSIWLADVNGRVVKAIVNKSLSEFF